MYETFIDLDELILKCRDKKSQILIKEAVACYRAGAFRSCIVSTWNAVVFDFVHKMRELELFGDSNAKNLLETFEQLRNNHKVKELWDFESAIPERAVKDFELISNLEQSDIKRLLEDRNRCAHPSMISSEEPFEATAELARYHLRSAVTHLLARQPVQGRKAKERLFEDIKSQYFPIDKEKAKVYLQNSPLSRARFTLVKDIVLGLTTSLLTDDFEEQENLRQFAALTAISEMYHEYTYKILDEDLSKIILNKVSDDNWGIVIIYLGTITTWNNLSEPCILKAIAYIESVNICIRKSYRNSYGSICNIELSQDALTMLFKASHISFLRTSVINKITTISMQNILAMKNICNDSFFKNQILIPIIKERSAKASLNELVQFFLNLHFNLMLIFDYI